MNSIFKSFRWEQALSFLCLLLSTVSFAHAREIVDMAERKVIIPEQINRIYASAPPLTVLLQAIAPETMIGLSLQPDEDSKSFLPPRLAALPVLGGVFGMGAAMNPEEILELKPDIAIAWKSPFIDQAMVENAFAKIGLPVVFVSLDTLADWPQALLFIGKLLGHEDIAQQQADYINRSLAKVGKAVAAIPEQQRVRVYYAEAPNGLATDCHRSFHTEVIELAGGYNVYRCQPQNHMGMDAISLEQVIAFDPQVILAQDPKFGREVVNDPRWKNIRAVREGRVYTIPHWPHNWMDRPPSLMRALGMQWLAHLLYPDLLPLDLRRETGVFYRLFLGVDLNDAELDRLLR